MGAPTGQLNGRNKRRRQTPCVGMDDTTHPEPPPVARYGTRIEDLRDGLRGTVLGLYGMAFSAVMDDDTVRYYGKTRPSFRLARN